MPKNTGAFVTGYQNQFEFLTSKLLIIMF